MPRRARARWLALAGAAWMLACGSSGFQPGDHAPLPQVVDDGSPRLAHVDLVTVTFAGFPFSAQVEALDDWMVVSDWYAEIGREYGIGTGTVSAKLRLADRLPRPDDAQGPVPTIDEISAYVSAAVSSGRFPPPRHDGMYMLYFATPSCGSLPPGFHDSVTLTGSTQPVAYGAVVWCEGDPLQALEVAASHELAEAATDPYPEVHANLVLPSGHPWGFEGGEIGDLCAGTSTSRGGHRVQRIWSNAQAARGEDPCAPIDPVHPYFNLSVDPLVVSVEAGDFARLRVRAWSTAPIPRWTTALRALIPSTGTFIPLIRDPLTGDDSRLESYTFTPIPGATLMNNGEQAELLLVVPFGTPGGERATIVFGSIADDEHLSAIELEVR
jgi:hypothetical protein